MAISRVRVASLDLRARIRMALAMTVLLQVVGTQIAQSQTYKVIYDFSGRPDGAIPQAGLTIDAAGNLYGTTALGGRGGLCNGDGCGMVFKLARQDSAWNLTQLYAFQGDSDGAFPQAKVIIGPNHSLYGTTLQGGTTGCDNNCGTVFSLTGSSTARVTEIQLHRFIGGSDGFFPGTGELVLDRDGHLYGTTSGGGIHNQGIVYELGNSNGSWTEKVIHNFSGIDGGNPFAGVVFDRAGNLYGTTAQENPTGFGTVFQLMRSSSGWVEKTLYTFTDGSDGSFPVGGLIVDQSGNLYGTASSGGSGLGGTIFELTPDSDGTWAFHLLYSFAGDVGAGPISKLTMDAAGNLYGTTMGDGVHFDGSVFKLTRLGPFDWSFTSLHDFSGGGDGNLVYGGVVLDANGNLFGTAGQGGGNGCSGNGCGVIFQIVP